MTRSSWDQIKNVLVFVLTKKPRHNQTRFVALTIKNSNYRNNDDDDENDNNNDNDNEP